MSDPPFSDIDFKNKNAWVRTTINFTVESFELTIIYIATVTIRRIASNNLVDKTFKLILRISRDLIAYCRLNSLKLLRIPFKLISFICREFSLTIEKEPLKPKIAIWISIQIPHVVFICIADIMKI